LSTLSFFKTREYFPVFGVLDLFTVLAVDETMYEVYGRLAAGLSRAGTPVGDFDEIITAITLCHDGKIITRDRHFEKIPGISGITS